jgi:predicted transcriptional regulator
MVDARPDGLDRQDVAELLGLTPERVRQIEERGALKLRAAVACADTIDEARRNLPEGTRLHVVYEQSNHTEVIAITMVVRVALDGRARSTGGENSRANGVIGRRG